MFPGQEPIRNSAEYYGVAMATESSATPYTERRGDVVIASPPSEVTAASLDAFLGELQSNLDSGREYALVVDMTHTGSLSAKDRRRVSEHITANRERVRRTVRGIAIVTPSAVKRGIITAVFWLSPPPTEHRIFDNVNDAIRWAAGQVEQKPPANSTGASM